eukprot:TRINITY_DN290_c0_g1_i1.p1 TRINITY_DN290_c0_g1~~TRINITY_DN290_c0_g1_i1.p1  ORF type:complete len:346 (-),score=135.22 TRINITY_DN290_c0_g1_i1:113-1150(-)
MVKFSEDLWDSFDVVAQRTEIGTQVARDLAEFLKKRAELEQDYAKKLASLSKTPLGASMFSKQGSVEKEAKSIRTAIVSMQEESAKIANAHLEFSAKLVTDVIKPLETFIKTKEADRKKHISEGQKKQKALTDAKTTAERARDAYVKAGKESDAASEAHEKAQKELSADAENKKLKENEKRASQKVGPAADKVKAAEAAYHKAVETANELQGKSFTEHMPAALDALQQYEQERFGQIQGSVGDFLRLQKLVPTQMDTYLMDFAKQVDAMDHDADIDEFVKNHTSNAREPTPIPIVNYKDNLPVEAAASSSSSSSSSSSKAKEDDKAKAKDKPSEEDKKEEEMFQG